jgi:adenosylhomocysteine nucleosidase
MTRRIGIIAALQAELAPLVEGWTRADQGVWRTRRGESNVVAAAKGMGAARAEQAVLAAEATLRSAGPLTALVSVGWAGASTCGVYPGNAYEVGEVLDILSGERYATAGVANPVILVTTDHVAGREEKHGYAVNQAASLVDMEAATVARMARERQIPFYCWKAITDTYTENLPEFAPFLDSERQLQTGRLARYAITHPRVIPALVRLGRNGRSGATALRDSLKLWMDQQQ